MKYYNRIEIELLLNDIDEIINQVLLFMYYPELINDVEELYDTIKSIPEKITEIKNIMEEELIENESYFESQDES